MGQPTTSNAFTFQVRRDASRVETVVEARTPQHAAEIFAAYFGGQFPDDVGVGVVVEGTAEVDVSSDGGASWSCFEVTVSFKGRLVS